MRGDAAAAADAAPWPSAVTEILESDQVFALAYATPAAGAVVVPVTNFATYDPRGGTVTVNTSIAAWRKLDRIRREPRVALALHTREHSRCSRPEYVLMQGRAELSPLEDRHGWYDAVGDNWERFTGEPRHPGPIWEWWMSAFYWRVNLTVHVERTSVWPDLACGGDPEVHGTEPPDEFPARQRAPRHGTAPRIAHARAARRAARLPNRLLAWIDADGFPYVVPAGVAGVDLDGIRLRPPEGLVPPGARRAGLTAHWFSRDVVGQNQRVHTGWLEAGTGDGTVLYAPHTAAAYRLPASRLLFRLVVGLETRRRLPAARRALLGSEK